eukprot:15450537-Alexandrium_andersonii.AAC.1
MWLRETTSSELTALPTRTLAGTRSENQLLPRLAVQGWGQLGTQFFQPQSGCIERHSPVTASSCAVCPLALGSLPVAD